MKSLAKSFIASVSATFKKGSNDRDEWYSHGFSAFRAGDAPDTDDPIAFAADTFRYFCLEGERFNNLRLPIGVIHVWLTVTHHWNVRNDYIPKMQKLLSENCLSPQHVEAYYRTSYYKFPDW